MSKQNKLGVVALVTVAFVLALTFSATASAATSCESLSGLKLDNTTITLAQSVEAGAFTLPAAGARWQSSTPASSGISAASLRRSSPAPIRKSKSKSGCLPRDGTASSRASATERGAAPSKPQLSQQDCARVCDRQHGFGT